MISKEQYLASLEHEFKAIRHLATKIKPEFLDYRPTPGQRSLLELLQYMSYIFSMSIEGVVSGQMPDFMKWTENSRSLQLADFDVAMEKQMGEIREKLMPLSDEQLDEVVEIWVKQSRAMHFLNGPLKWAAAYKMQLFLYLKACGLSDLSTMNLWAGMDAQPRA